MVDKGECREESPAAMGTMRGHSEMLTWAECDVQIPVINYQIGRFR